MPLFITSGFLKQPKDNCFYQIFSAPCVHCQVNLCPSKSSPGLACGAADKNPPANARNPGLIPGPGTKKKVKINK